jgi:hypothetical protein
MDDSGQDRAIDERLDALTDMPVTDDEAARAALRHAIVTVGQINQVSARTRAQAMIGSATPIDDMLVKFSEWVDRLVAALTMIVRGLADAASFSVTVGTAVEVTVNFGPFEHLPPE